MKSSTYWDKKIEDNVFINLKIQNTMLHAFYNDPMETLFSLEVFLQKGYIVLNGLKKLQIHMVKRY